MAWLKMVEFPTRLCEVKGELGYFHLTGGVVDE